MSEFERQHKTENLQLYEDREKNHSIELTGRVIIAEPPPIPMKLEMPELENAIREGKKIAESTSKSTKRKPKKDHSKPDRPAVEKVQEEF